MKKLDLSTGKMFHTTEVDSTHSRTMLVPFKHIFSQVVLNPEASSTPVEVQAFRLGNWDHPVYGKVDITPAVFSDMETNFSSNVYGQDIPITFEHGLDASKGLQAAGWVRGVKTADGALSYSIEFTKDALQEIKDGKWRYFSPEYHDDYENPETKQVYHNVLVGGSLTNAPFFKGMQPLNFSELFTEKEQVVPEVVKPIITPPEGVIPLTFREQLVKLAKELDLEVKTDETDEALEARCFSAIKAQRTELEPLRQLKKDMEGSKTFAEQFPDQAKRMEELEIANRESEARSFSERYMRFHTIEGEGDNAKKKADTKGFSALALEKIAGLRKSFSTRTATPEQFSEFLDLIASGAGILDYGNIGSTQEPEVKDLPVGSISARKQFSDLVAKVKSREENKDKAFPEVVAIAANENPELFELYQRPVMAASAAS